MFIETNYPNEPIHSNESDPPIVYQTGERGGEAQQEEQNAPSAGHEESCAQVHQPIETQGHDDAVNSHALKLDRLSEMQALRIAIIYL